MLAALFKTFRTIGRPYFWNMLVLSLLVTAVAFGVLFLTVGYILSTTAFVSTGWLDTILDWTAGLGTGVLAWFLFPALLPLVASLFLEQIAGRIERREYDLEPLPSLPFWPEVLAGLKFTGVSLLLNLIALPLYLVPVLFPFVYYTLNSYLLGREFFETVAGRHVGRREASSPPPRTPAAGAAYRVDHSGMRHPPPRRIICAIYWRCRVCASFSGDNEGPERNLIYRQQRPNYPLLNEPTPARRCRRFRLDPRN